MRTVASRLTVGSIVAGLLLSGCGGSPEPKALPKPTESATPSASASASSTPNAPVLPVAARAKTKAGAEAVVRYFLASLNYSGLVGDTSLLRKAYVDLCTKCEGIADGIDKTYAAGGYYRGGDWIARRVKFYSIEGDVAILDADVHYTAQTWLKSADASPTEFAASGNHLHAFQLKWTPGVGWRVGALDPQQ